MAWLWRSIWAMESNDERVIRAIVRIFISLLIVVTICIMMVKTLHTKSATLISAAHMMTIYRN